jgi:signal transduction histidine kinase
MTVVVVPAWWQQWWFPTILLIAFTSLVVFVVRYWSHRRLRNRLQDLQREHALDQERARIARDLHDELGGSLTQIRMLAERLRRHASSPEALSVTAQIAARTRHVTGELESIVWTVSPKNHTWDRLAAFIGQYSLRFFRDTSIACTVHGIELVPALPLRPDQQHHILALTKEALNNILKHAQASEVRVQFEKNERQAQLTIQDNGQGFELPKDWLVLVRAGHLGLLGMRERAEAVGGTLEVTSQPRKGTLIQASVPVKTPFE